MPNGISIQIISYNHPEHAANAVYSCFLNEHDFDFEILILENGNKSNNKEILFSLLKQKGLANDPRIRYFEGYSNLGFADGFNFLSQQARYDYFVQLNEDMYFSTYALELLLKALQSDPRIGIACCSLTNGGMYDKLNPKLEDVENFSSRHSGALEENMSLACFSNPPWIVHKDLWWKLASFDVFEEGLTDNLYKGALDAGLDRLCGWTVDWSYFRRIEALGYLTIGVSNSYAYHYDHLSGSELDVSTKGTWTQLPVIRYVMKFDTFDKRGPITRRKRPDNYPI